MGALVTPHLYEPLNVSVILLLNLRVCFGFRVSDFVLRIISNQRNPCNSFGDDPCRLLTSSAISLPGWSLGNGATSVFPAFEFGHRA
jgi:hypothetical protein